MRACVCVRGYVRVCARAHETVTYALQSVKKDVLSMYCCQIWSQYDKNTVRKLPVGYNHAFRRIMKYDIICSASDMLVVNNVMAKKFVQF